MRKFDSILKCQKGFTLMEVAIALSIMSIASGIVMASFAFFERRQLHSAAVELQLSLRYAQNMALQEGARHSIVFFPQNNSYMLRRMDDNFYATVRQVQVENARILSVTAVNNTVSFTPRGTTGSASTITLQSNRYSVNLTVSLGAGRVLIHDIVPNLNLG